MRVKVMPALGVGLLVALLAAGCSNGSGDAIYGGTGESEWIGVYGGEGDIHSVVAEGTCLGATVQVTLVPDGDGGLLTEIWWEQAQQDGQECPYDIQCAPASDFNVNDGGSCFVFNLFGQASETRFVGEDKNSNLGLTLSLDRTGDYISGTLITQPLSSIVVPHGEIIFQLERCSSLPCEH